MLQEIDLDSSLEMLYGKYDFQCNFLFKGLSPDEREYIENSMEPLFFRKGSLLFHEGGIPTGVYYLRKGKLKKYKITFNGNNQIFYIHSSGDLLGYHALLCDERHGDSCDAIEDCQIDFISADIFKILMNAIPTLRNSVIKNISHEFGVLTNTIALLAQKSQSARLANFLLVFENRFRDTYGAQDGIDLSREDLANIVGTTRESLGRSLKLFRDEGLIEIEDRKIYLKDRERMLELIENSSN